VWNRVEGAVVVGLAAGGAAAAAAAAATGRAPSEPKGARSTPQTPTRRGNVRRRWRRRQGSPVAAAGAPLHVRILRRR